jgi:hypothetical protein
MSDDVSLGCSCTAHDDGGNEERSRAVIESVIMIHLAKA